MVRLRALGRSALPLLAGFIFASAAQAEFVTGFEHDPTGFPIPSSTVPSTWVQIRVPAGGETATFGNNSATFIGGAHALPIVFDGQLIGSERVVNLGGGYRENSV